MPGTLSQLAPLGGRKQWGFLHQARQIRLASTNAESDGIHMSSCWFVVRDERVYVPLDPEAPFASALPATRHIQNIQAGGRVAGIVDEGEGLSDRRAVTFDGTASLVEDEALANELLDLVLEKYFYVEHPHLEQYLFRGSVEARRWARLEPDTIEGGDARELPQVQALEWRAFPAEMLRG